MVPGGDRGRSVKEAWEVEAKRQTDADVTETRAVAWGQGEYGVVG